MSSAPGGALAESLAALRTQLALPTSFPPDVLAEAEAAAHDVATDPDAAHVDDLRGIPFLTIDPEGSTDLDQAMHFERTPGGAILHYAIADVPAYARPGGAVDAEARRRGQTMYAPDGRIPLHPPVLSEDAASLLPDRDRRAYVWRFVLDEDAQPVETTVRRAVVRSRAQWTYRGAQAAIDDGSAPDALAALAWFGPQRAERERERGGASLNIPDTEVVAQQGGYRLVRGAPLPVEEWNAHVSLLTGMAAAEIMLRGGIGILRTMPPASADDQAAFRVETIALGIPWRFGVAYGDYLRSLDREDPAAQAVRDAAAGLFRGAGYLAFDGDVPDDPVQAAIGAPYAHATAPLRRLVDRWSLILCEAIANDRWVPDWVRESLPELPRLMARSSQRTSQLESGSIDRVEAAVMQGREGEIFTGAVLGRRGDGARVQLIRPPAQIKVPGLESAAGSLVRLRLDGADVATGGLDFTLVDGA
ncbi:RNB domain-containing ribonuclease [Microbacterium ulmi]